MPAATATHESSEPGLHLWLRWVAANAGAELIGLGGSGLTLVNFFRASDTAETVGTILLQAGLAILLGTFLEGVVVGAAQWTVLRGPLPRLRWQTWVRATSIGAGIAWLFGMLPSTIISIEQLSSPAALAAGQEPALPVVLALAAVMGFALGPVLAAPQYLALNWHVERAGWWILANALAWAPGMAVIFLGTSAIPADGALPAGAIAALVGAILAAGAVVGAIHGLALVRLLRRRRQRPA